MYLKWSKQIRKKKRLIIITNYRFRSFVIEKMEKKKELHFLKICLIFCWYRTEKSCLGVNKTLIRLPDIFFEVLALKNTQRQIKFASAPVYVLWSASDSLMQTPCKNQPSRPKIRKTNTMPSAVCKKPHSVPQQCVAAPQSAAPFEL